MSDCCGQEPIQAPPSPKSPADTGDASHSVFAIPGMDCPSEERMIRMALDDIPGIKALSFDLPGRRLQVWHTGEVASITGKLAGLGMGAQLESSADADQSMMPEDTGPTPEQEAGTLRVLLAINAIMFFIELATGWLAQSTGLIADSLDMFADATVYGLALYAVGRSARMKLRAAHLAGLLQLLLALGVFWDVVQRLLGGSEPDSGLMIGIAILALVANVYCLWLISAHREGGAHMRASWIFSATDVLANLGVIAAGGLVALTGSPYPDLVIGTLIGLVVLNGARRILSLKG